jgi:hypothetical protein
MNPGMLQKIMKKLPSLRDEFDRVLKRGTIRGMIHGKCDTCRGHADIFAYDVPPDLVPGVFRVGICRPCMKKATGNDGGLGI